MDIYSKRLANLSKQQQSQLLRIFEKSNSEVAKAIEKYQLKYPKTYKRGAFWRLNKRFEEEVDSIIKSLRFNLENNVYSNIENSWQLANLKNNNLVNNYIKNMSLGQSIISGYKKLNLDALQAFLNRSRSGMTISANIWKYTKVHKSALEAFIGSGIVQGKSAARIATQLKKFEIHPDKVFRRVRNNKGELVLSKPAKMYKPLKGAYRSSYKNAVRLARTENMIAFHTCDYIRREQLDFVIGVKVLLSAAHPRFDICDGMEGDYPKGFKFTGWHPQCYSDDTEIYTNSGWKLFKDVNYKDLILSLNPKTKNIEWTKIIKKIKYKKQGKMIRFYNRSLDLLVTPEHKMIYLTKDGNYKIKQNKLAVDYSQFNGGLYRGCKYQAKEKKTIKIGEHILDFNLFAEFLGYYLSEGSFSRKYHVIISQSKKVNPKNYEFIRQCIENLGIHYTCTKTAINIRDKAIYKYVQKFGKSDKKYIPTEIKNSGIENIKSFLKAFNLGDGSIRKGKLFTGNRGGTGMSKNEIIYSTSSKQMADDLGELIFKIGKRPSFYIWKIKGKKITHKNGIYSTKNNQIIIRECRSHTATQFKKDFVDYDGYVYDLEIAKNHILWTKRNGKTVWGSNCICYTQAILAKKGDFVNYLQTGQKNWQQINKIPNRATNYLQKNKDKIAKMAKRPYFIRDNFDKNLSLKKQVLDSS